MIGIIIGIFILLVAIVWAELNTEDDWQILRTAIYAAGIIILLIGLNYAHTQDIAKDYDSGKITKEYRIDSKDQVIDSTYVYKD